LSIVGVRLTFAGIARQGSVDQGAWYSLHARFIGKCGWNFRAQRRKSCDRRITLINVFESGIGELRTGRGETPYRPGEQQGPYTGESAAFRAVPDEQRSRVDLPEKDKDQRSTFYREQR